MDRRNGLQQQFENDAEQDGDSIFGCVMISFSVRSQFQQNFQQLYNERMHQVQLTTAHYQQMTPVVQTQLRETYISSNGNKIERQCSLTVCGRDGVTRVRDMFQHYTGQQASLTVSHFPPQNALEYS